MVSAKKQSSFVYNNSSFGWLALIVVTLLAAISLVILLSNGMTWSLSDFLIAGILLFGVGSLFILGAQKLRTTSHRIVGGVILLLMTIYIWAELAVGIFTNIGN